MDPNWSALDTLDLDQAYAVQTEFARLRRAADDVVVGCKICCIGPSVVEQFPMSGGAARNVVGIRGTISSNVKLSDHAARSIG